MGRGVSGISKQAVILVQAKPSSTSSQGCCLCEVPKWAYDEILHRGP